MEGESQPAPPVQQDPIDLQFAFLDVLPYLTDDESLTLRAGRFGMSFGSGRLVATRAAPNIPFRFDGFEAIYARPLWEATAFLTRPVEETAASAAAIPARRFGDFTSRTGSTRRTSWELTYITLAFTTTRPPTLRGLPRKTGIHSGLRIFGERNQWDWNEEDVMQVGSFGNKSILAWTASLDSGYTFDAMWQPRLGLKADVASGSGKHEWWTPGNFRRALFQIRLFQRRQPDSSAKHH